MICRIADAQSEKFSAEFIIKGDREHDRAI